MRCCACGGLHTHKTHNTTHTYTYKGGGVCERIVRAYLFRAKLRSSAAKFKNPVFYLAERTK